MLTKRDVCCFTVVFFTAFVTSYTTNADQYSQQDAERYIVQSERQWAESVASGATAPIERILAEDFIGVEPDGSMYDKAKAIAETRNGPTNYISNHLNMVKVRFYVDTAVAQGSESWERRFGEPRRGQFVWTDTWIRRNGNWQIVAAEDLIVPKLMR